MNDPAPVGPTCDLAICGGGMVGATLALALAPLDLSIVLIEAAAPDAAEPPSFDERTTEIRRRCATKQRPQNGIHGREYSVGCLNPAGL